MAPCVIPAPTGTCTIFQLFVDKSSLQQCPATHHPPVRMICHHLAPSVPSIPSLHNFRFFVDMSSLLPCPALLEKNICSLTFKIIMFFLVSGSRQMGHSPCCSALKKNYFKLGSTGTLKITLPVKAQLACYVGAWWAGSTCGDFQTHSTSEGLHNRLCDCP